MMFTVRPIWCAVLATTLVLSAPNALGATKVGGIVFAKGVATAQETGGGVRVLGTGSDVMKGDVLTTGKRSFAVVKLEDGTKLTLRPDTVFSVEEFRASETKRENNAVLRLFKGGLRAVTGFISKRNPKGYRVRTAVGTIGIRGTEFEARICEDDCAEEAHRLKRVKGVATKNPVAGRIVFMKGRVNASKAVGQQRALVLGGAVYEGDLVETVGKSFAVIAFQDKSRVTLQPATKFKIERHQYRSNAQDGMFLSLIKGGFRTVTGLIGKRNKRAFRVRTPVATIGIRGTGFDVLCQGSCRDSAQSAVDPVSPWMKPLAFLFGEVIPTAHAQTGDGMVVSVWSGEVVVNLASGQLVVGNGRTYFVPNETSQPIQLPDIPVYLKQELGPRPDQPESTAPGMEQPFQSQDQAGLPKPGLYLQVYDGETELQTDDAPALRIAAGEHGYASNDGNEVIRLADGPRIVATPSPGLFDDPSIGNFLQLIGGDDSPIGESNFQCIVK